MNNVVQMFPKCPCGGKSETHVKSGYFWVCCKECGSGFGCIDTPDNRSDIVKRWRDMSNKAHGNAGRSGLSIKYCTKPEGKVDPDGAA